MNLLENIASGASVLSWEGLLLMALGVLVGSIFGLLPGLNATLTLAIVAPFTFSLEPLVAIPLLIGLYRGALYGGSVTAILLGIPGTAASVPTMLDGYALAKRGYPLTAIRASLYSSAFGSLVAAVVLLTIIEQAARLALKIGSPELFALLVMSMSFVVLLSGKDLAKGVFSAALGLMIGAVGLDPVTGTARFTFGASSLLSGFSIVAVFIGLFAVSEMVIMVERSAASRGTAPGSDLPLKGSEDDNIRRVDVIRRYWRTIVTSSGIGTFTGILPGVGAETAPWIAYGMAKRFGKFRERIGTGEPEGIIASEAANDAVASSAFVPTLVFGIPGDLALAVMIGALTVHGLRPGPQLFNENPEAIFGIVLSVLISSIILVVVMGPLTLPVSRVVRLPSAILVPVIASLCIAGAFSINSEPFDLYILTAFGFVGIAMRLTETPFAPFVLAFILGPPLESTFRQSLMLNEGYGIFIDSPFSIAALGTALFVIVGSIIAARSR